MTRQEALQIIQTEGLSHFNMYEERYHQVDEVGIQRVKNQWVVYATGERADVIPGSEFYFDSEEEALDQFIWRVRAGKRIEDRAKYGNLVK